MPVSDINKSYELKSNSNHITTKDVASIVDNVDNQHTNNPLHKYRLVNFLYKPPFGLPRSINVPLIRDISRSIYVYALINRIIDEITTTKWDIRVKEGVEMTPELEKTRREMIEFFKNPNSMNESFESLTRQVLLDLIVLDSGILIKVFNPITQKMVEIKAADGGTFTKNPDIFNTFNERDELIMDGFAPNFQTPESAEAKKFVQNGILTQFRTIYNDSAAYFQYSNFSTASAPIAFGKREVVWMMKNQQPGGVYSYGSPVQASVDTAMSLIFGGKYNLDYFLNGNTPEGIINVAGADPDTLNAVKKQLQNKMEVTDNTFGISRRLGHNLPTVNSEKVEFIPLNFTSKDLEIITQAKWFMRLLYQMLGLTPDEMGENENSNKSTADQGTKNALRKAYKPYMNVLEYNYTRSVLSEWDEGSLFEFKFDDTDLSRTKEELDIAEQEQRLGIKTSEMIAEEMGIDLERLKKSKKESVEVEESEDVPENAEETELKSIFRDGPRFIVSDERGKQVLGVHDTFEEAEKQLQSIDIEKKNLERPSNYEEKNLEKGYENKRLEDKPITKEDIESLLRMILNEKSDDITKEEVEEDPSPELSDKEQEKLVLNSPVERVVKEYMKALENKTQELEQEAIEGE